MNKLATTMAAVAAAALLAACSDSKPAAEKPAETPAAEAAKPAAPAGMSGADFVAGFSGLNGKPVSLALCLLGKSEVTGGQLGCRVVDADGKDIKDKNNLPVDVFILASAPGVQDYVKTKCAEDYCRTSISGTLEVSPGTDFLVVKDPLLTAAP